MKYCEEYAALLDPFVDGECSRGETAQIQEHLKTCPGCRDYVRMALAIRDAFPDAEDAPVPADFALGVLSAVRTGKFPQKKKSIPWKRVLVSLAACCAIVVLVRFGSFGWVGGSSGSTADSATAESGMMKAYIAADSSAACDAAPAGGESDFGDAGQSSDGTITEMAPANENGTSASALQPRCLEVAPSVYRKQIVLTSDEVGDLLDNYDGAADYDSVSGQTSTTYELSEAEFDDIVAQIGAGDEVAVDDAADTDLCCIVVYS